MEKLPLFNIVSHVSDRYPIRVSTQAVRDRGFCHFHQLVQLCFVISGELRHTVNGKEYIQRPGSCVFLLPYMPHILDSIDSDDTPIIVYLWFHESFLTEHGYDFSSYGEGRHFEGLKIPVMCEFHGAEDEATQLIRSMVSEYDRAKDMQPGKMAKLVATLFRIACTEKQEARNSTLLPGQVRCVERAISHMSSNYSSKISLDELAAVAGMSRRSLSEHFKRITGLSAAHFLTSIRISHTARYLDSDMLYDEIAQRCGLSDHTNLARVFVKYLGVTPTEFYEHRRRWLSTPHQFSHRERYSWLYE